MGPKLTTPRPVIMATEASIRSADGTRIFEINLDANNDGHSVSVGSIVFIIGATLLGAWILKKIWQRASRYRLQVNRNQRQVLPVVNVPAAAPAPPIAAGQPQQDPNVLQVPRIQI